MVLLIVKNINNIWIKYLSLYLSLWSRIFRIFFEAGFFYLLKLELGIVRWCWIWWRSKENGLIVVPTGFQTDNSKSRCDWLAPLSRFLIGWERHPPRINLKTLLGSTQTRAKPTQPNTNGPFEMAHLDIENTSIVRNPHSPPITWFTSPWSELYGGGWSWYLLI